MADKITLSTASITFIIEEEVTSESFYNKAYTHPTWPQGDSGITIAIGYDLGYNSRSQITNDWADEIDNGALNVLLSVSGLKGEAARNALTASVKAVTIPYSAAYKVFVSKTLRQTALQSLAIYPGLEQLQPDAVGAIMSMIYNRGNGLGGDRRIEMRNIVPLVSSKNYQDIAAQISASKRWWVGQNGMQGLVTRREKEAQLVANANRQYQANDLVTINLN